MAKKTECRKKSRVATKVKWAAAKAKKRAPLAVKCARQPRWPRTNRLPWRLVQAPAGQEPNWIYTVADRDREWFAIFRFHGPQKSLFEKTWRLSDIEEADPPLVIAAIDNCRPSAIHRKFVITGLERGKHVFCETSFAA
jgi:hypothetical protein